MPTDKALMLNADIPPADTLITQVCGCGEITMLKQPFTACGQNDLILQPLRFKRLGSGTATPTRISGLVCPPFAPTDHCANLSPICHRIVASFVTWGWYTNLRGQK
jgi:hypothetical protein